MITILTIIIVILIYKKIFQILKNIIENIKRNKQIEQINFDYKKYNNKQILNDAITEEEYNKKQEKISSDCIIEKTIQNTKNINDTQINYNYFYKPKRYVTTLNELIFYQTLLEICKELDLILFSQVSLYSIIEVKQNLNKSLWAKYFNKINRKSIDFVLVDKTNCRIKLCIELDDKTHNKKNRIQRDLFINELFQQLHIKLLRYPVYPKYYKETLKEKIKKKIEENY